MNKKPNIIFVLSDQQRWDTIGAYGQELPITPNLDKMAKEGVLFENAISVQPVCGPARACIQTGKYPTQVKSHRNFLQLPFEEKTIAHYFSENKYELGYIGKWHLAYDLDKFEGPEKFHNRPTPPERRGGWNGHWLVSDLLEFTSHGYDGYLYDGNMNRVDFKGYRVDKITDFGLDYLRNRKTDRPFFLFLSYIEPHYQNDHNHFEGPKGSKEKFKNFKTPGDLEGMKGDWQEELPDYLGCCNSLDHNLGRIRAYLDKAGLSDNTIIIYMSDHGCHFRTRNDEYKRSCHEASIHIPLIIHGPGFTGGKRVSNLVSLIDIVPTLLKIGDIDIPSYMVGTPLQDIINNNVSNRKQEVFIQISESDVGRALRTPEWKYFVHDPDKDPWNDTESDAYKEHFLYDLENDPHEKKNLIRNEEYKETRQDLAKRLKAWIRKIEGKDVTIVGE